MKKKVLAMLLAMLIMLSMCNTIIANAAPTVYSQLDSTWASHPYGYSDSAGKNPTTIGPAGCGILALVNAVYYMNGNFIDPVLLADYSVKNGYRVNGVGTSYGLYKSFASSKGTVYGFSCTSSNNGDSVSALKNHIIDGNAAIIGTKTIATGGGHIMAIVDYNSSNNTFLILDSYVSKNRFSSSYSWQTINPNTMNTGNGKVHIHTIVYIYNDSTPPSTPTLSSVSATADDEITIKWKSVSGATSYILQGRKAGGDYANIKELSETSYTHKNLDEGSLYWYRVKAKNSAGTSDYSTANAAYTKPNTPTTSITGTTNSIKVNWSSSGGSTNYELLARKCGDDEYATIAKNLSGYTYTHTGLEAGTQYYYKIKAHNTEHTSIVSARSDSGTGYTKLNAPIVKSKSAQNVSLSWDGFKGDGAYTYTYRVKRCVLGSDYTNVATVSGKSYNDSNLKPNTTYRYYIEVLRDGESIIHSMTTDVTTNVQLAESISVSPKSLTLTEGDTYTLSAQITPSNTTNKSITWKSSNTSVASVSSTGVITAHKKGTANITVTTSNGLSASCALTVQSIKDNCTHSFSKWTIVTKPNCTEKGRQERSCSICGKTESEQIASLGHTEVIDEAVEATCEKTGLTEGSHCNVCGKILKEQEETKMLEHTDKNKDGYCDACDFETEKISNCTCNCHKTGIAKFFFNIINFFQKLFGQNKVCACGKAH